MPPRRTPPDRFERLIECATRVFIERGYQPLAVSFSKLAGGPDLSGDDAQLAIGLLADCAGDQLELSRLAMGHDQAHETPGERPCSR